MTKVQKIIDQELAQFGWVDSIATNSISDFKSPKSNVLEQIDYKNNSDLIDNFIYHLFFYLIFCYALFLYVFIDLGFGSFLRKKLFTWINQKKQGSVRLLIFNTFSK
tara:strand:+ start:430 stop:750 length:321 start_codon:yes stop_codon:yes gene_type:complete